MTVDIFIPCIIDQFFPQTGMNMVKILEKVGIEVNYNTEQTCCGKIAYNNGFWDEAKAMGEKFIREFSGNRYVVAPTASCTGFVRNYFDQMFYNSALHIEYHQLKRNMFEFTDFLVNIADIKDVGAVFEHVVTYHDSCAALREYKLDKQPRILLNAVRGLELREMADTQSCCGFGDSFALKHESISTSMAKQKVENALQTGAEYIVSTDASCLMQLQSYIDENNIAIKTMHIVDVLASGW